MNYLIKRILLALPILLGVNFITFALFFMVNTPDDMARMQLGTKHVTQEAIESWKKEHAYDAPLFYNPSEQGLDKWTHTLFYRKSIRLFAFDFGVSDSGRDIGEDISIRMWPSLAIALPSLLLGIAFNVTLALVMVFFREYWVDRFAVVFCIVLMSISPLFYIIGGQYLFGKVLKWVPISGYDSGLMSIKFVILPVMVSLMSGLGAGVRWYRGLFLEEIHKEYVKTAISKGLGEGQVLFRHVFRNALIPILTGVVVILPSLFMGSLVLESFFGVPGLGSYVIDAITQQDFAIVRSMVFLGAVLYILGLILTDISYTLADPRVRLSS